MFKKLFDQKHRLKKNYKFKKKIIFKRNLFFLNNDNIIIFKKQKTITNFNLNFKKWIIMI